MIIELKVSRGYQRVIGQVLYYRNRIKQQFKCPRARIIIIAKTISPETRIACEGLPDVELFEYQIAVRVNKVA